MSHHTTSASPHSQRPSEYVLMIDPWHSDSRLCYGPVVFIFGVLAIIAIPAYNTYVEQAQPQR